MAGPWKGFKPGSRLELTEWPDYLDGYDMEMVGGLVALRRLPRPGPFTCLQLPPRLQKMRQKLFSLQEPIVFESEEEHRRYWKFLDNFWSPEFFYERKDGQTVQYYRCLMWSK